MNFKQKPPQSHDFEADPYKVLAATEEMPAGSEGIEVLKRANQLQIAADTYALIFATGGRPSK